MFEPEVKYKMHHKSFNYFKDFVGKNKKIKIGVLSTSPSRDDGVDAVYLASIHEFGAPNANIPERSFLRKTMINYKDKIRTDIKSARTYLKQMILSNNPDWLWNQLGMKIVGLVHETFDQEGPGWQGLADSTIKARKRKGKRAAGNNDSEIYKILQDTSQMKRSISYEVVDEK